MTEPKTPSVAIGRVLRDLGLRQRGPLRDFRVEGVYGRGDRLYTRVLLLDVRADLLVAENADVIERESSQLGFPFRVSVEQQYGRTWCIVANNAGPSNRV